MISRAVVVGGGVAGHAAAIALRRLDVAVTVLEERAADDEAGSFLRLNPNGLDALAALGVLDPVVADSFPVRRVERRDLAGTVLADRPLADPDATRDLGSRFVTWAGLAGALRADSVRRGALVRHGARVVGAEVAGDVVTARLADGGAVEADLLVGADGVRSTIRTVIDPAAPAPEYRGSRTVYGYTRRAEPHVPPAPAALRSYLGPTGWLAHLDHPDSGEVWWFTNLRTGEPLPDPAPGTDEWRAELLGQWRTDDVPAGIIRPADRIRAADDRALPHLPRWHADRLVVIGDAAHAAPPASEQGAALAIEDAAVLGQCVRDLDLSDALPRFVRERRDRVETIIGVATGRRNVAEGPEWAYRHHVEWRRRLR